MNQLGILRESADRKYGHRTGFIANEAPWDATAIPTGWTMLDYALGTGGWPLGHQVEVFGVNDIGKSSLVAFNAIRNAQEMGYYCGWIALEPSFKGDWAEKHGVDLDRLILTYPENGEDAFSILHDWTTGRDTNGKPVLKYIVFDSIGAVNRKGEAESGLPSAYGAAGLITAGSRASLMPCFKHSIGVMYLNQVREGSSQNPNITVFDSPGGQALKHNCMVRVQLKPNGIAFRAKIDGVDTDIGRPLVAQIKRNKLAEGTGKRAVCDYYHTDVEGYPFGIDHIKDMLDTAKMTGVISGTGWLEHHTFPATGKGEHKLNGKKAVEDFWKENPRSEEIVRKEVLKVMAEKVAETDRIKKEQKHALQVAK